MKKKMISLLLVLALAVGICPAVFAAEAHSLEQDMSCVRIWENPNSDNDLAGTGDSVLRYGEREVIEVIATEKKTVTTIPDGQPSGGYSFPNYGGSVYVNTNGGASTSVGVAVSWGIVSISVSKGLASDSPTVGGICVNFPSGSTRHIVKLDHNYTIKREKIDYYKYNEYISTSYRDKYILDSIDARVVLP